MNEEAKQLALHWLAVGYVSPAARAWIKKVGGNITDLSSIPSLVVVALAYNPAGVWTWSHGKQEHRQGVEFWNTGEIQEASTGITLQYKGTGDSAAEYTSATETYLILPDEEFDPEIRQVKAASDEPPSGSDINIWGNLDSEDRNESPF